MKELDMKNYNMLFKQKQQKHQHYHEIKQIKTTTDNNHQVMHR